MRRGFDYMIDQLGGDITVIDIYLLHFPFSITENLETDHETCLDLLWQQMEEIYDEGLVRCLGVAACHAWRRHRDTMAIFRAGMSWS